MNMQIHQGLEEKWTIFFDGTSNALRHWNWDNIDFPREKLYPLTTRLYFPCTVTEFEACAMRVDG